MMEAANDETIKLKYFVKPQLFSLISNQITSQTALENQ